MSSASELAAVEELLLKVLPDPMGFAERVLGELADRLATPPPADGPAVVHGFQEPDHALADRDLLLAAALGACGCWGEAAGCPDCAGRGSPGWMPPDPELYEQYVAPAVRRAAPPARTGLARSEGAAPREERPDEGGTR
ncbi:hypothetical protein FXF51_53670 [Nonomuraea sp. PA05]|uniref:hypothetical protein n=1 Tax=Nonomuraea sp. PA05 TaxID=2604466 RepID=UPI0011D6F6D2|nr:hypothetical protein [Nonomuraea sp. PA05]TYB51331.1 hypothetical protein FXF51_53670 [Nonomuraea sp. PA05]